MGVGRQRPEAGGRGGCGKAMSVGGGQRRREDDAEDEGGNEDNEDERGVVGAYGSDFGIVAGTGRMSTHAHLNIQ